MGSGLRLATDLLLPIEAVTETFGILAKRGAGKTYTANVLAEEMVTAGAQVVILDPLDAWWGLRSSADGKADGLPVYVFGGDHGDLPLEAGAGELLADTVVDHGVSVILSLRHLSKTKQRQFVTAFCERLYRRKGEPEHRTPLHVFVDEADAFVPQRVMSDVARTVGAIDDIVRRGRSAGLGVTLISQRAAVVNKDVLTQCEVLIALRTISPQDRKALDAWVEAHDAHDQRGAFMDSLAALEIGEAWVWSPGWLDIFQRVRIRRRRTFDSSSTPKAGEKALTPATRKEVDLDALRGRMAETIERQQATDPKLLQKRIRELEKQLAEQPAAQVEKVVERIEVPVLRDEDRQRLHTFAESIRSTSVELGAAVAELVKLVERVSQELAAVTGQRPASPPERQAPTARPPQAREPRPAPRAASAEGATLTKAERALLSVLVTFDQGRSRQQLSILSGYSIKSSSFANALGSLRSGGLVEGRDPIVATSAGHAAIPDPEAMPRPGPELLNYWCGKLTKAERTMLEALANAYPHALTKDELSARTGYSSTSSSFANALGKLRALELAEGYGETRAADALFE